MFYQTRKLLTPVALILVGGLLMILVAGALGASPAAAGGPLPAQGGYPPVESITVTGYGEAAGSPDVAYLQLGLDISQEDLSAAVAEATGGMDSIIAALSELGIAAEDMQTLNFNVWSDEPYDPQTGMPGGQRIYRVNNILRVTVRDTSLVQTIIDAAIAAGANNIYGLNFGIDDPAALEGEARLQAIADARARAGQIAQAIGVSLGEPIIVTEGSDGYYGPVMEAARGLGGGGGIQEGQLTVNVQLQVTFAIVR